MPLPALVLAGLIIIPISIAIPLTLYGYRELRARRAQQQIQHHQWHRGNSPNIELSLTKHETDAQQAVKQGSWPRSLRGDEEMPSTRFTPKRTFPVPYWGLSDEWGPKDVPGRSLYLGPT